MTEEQKKRLIEGLNVCARGCLIADIAQQEAGNKTAAAYHAGKAKAYENCIEMIERVTK